jgi:hypothetical protein
MVSIVTKLTKKGRREVGLKIVFIFPLVFIITPLRVLAPCVLVAPNRLVLLGVSSSLPWINIILVFCLLFWHYSTGGSDFPYSVDQNFYIVEWERVEQN